MACPTGKLVVETKDPRINYNLLPGETLLTCPYNLSHAIQPLKFAKHVLNCHRMHCKDQEKLGQAPLFSICRFDRSHHVRNAELAFHESECTSRPKVEEIGPAPGGEEEDDKQQNEGADGELKIKLQKPPEVDKTVIESIMCEDEDWESEPAYDKTFDPDKRIMECRRIGYNVVQAHKAVGLTRSEKKQFYKTDAAVMKDFRKLSSLERMNDKASSSRQGSTSSGSSSATLTYSGYTSTGSTIGDIEEDEEAEKNEEDEFADDEDIDVQY